MYLSPELKDYYSKDFKEYVISSEDDFWDLDEGLLPVLEVINRHENFQTLYSKWYRRDANSIDLIPKSYLKITASQSHYSELGQRLMKVYDALNRMESPVDLDDLMPMDNENYNPDSNKKMGCISNPDFFRIRHFHIAIASQEDSVHQQFFAQMVEAFSIMK